MPIKQCGEPSEILTVILMLLMSLETLVTTTCQFRLVCGCCGGAINGGTEEDSELDLEQSRLPYHELKSSYSIKRHKSSNARSTQGSTHRQQIQDTNE